MRHDMTLPEWQALTLSNSKRWFPFAGDDLDQIIHQALGLCGEVGEVVEHVKKFHRGDFGTEELAERLHSELPDVLTYLLNLSELIGVDIAEALMEKQAICEQRWGTVDPPPRCGECGGQLIEAVFPDAPNLTATCVDCGTRHGDRAVRTEP